MAIQLVCFDMDGTLIRNTNSVRYLCALNGKLAALEAIETLEAEGDLDWVDADYRKVRLNEGLEIAAIEREFDHHIELIHNIPSVIATLKAKGIHCVLITAGPVLVADILGRRFGFDAVHGSQHAISDWKLRDYLTLHLDGEGKLVCLRDYCTHHHIELSGCVAVGDSESDIPIFNACRKSIAINATEAAVEAATIYIETEDLADVLPLLDTWQYR